MYAFPDIAVIGGGPVGCVTALAFARQGAQVLLLEAHPQAARRLAGEWLHPTGVAILQQLEVWPRPAASVYPPNHGFVVFTDDGTQPIFLRYPDAAVGMSCEHAVLVPTLREVAASHPNVRFMPHARVTHLDQGRLTFEQKGTAGNVSIVAGRIIGADGRSSIARKCLGLPSDRTLISYMAGLLLEDTELPSEGFGHVVLGGPGPALLFRVSARHLRLVLDVPVAAKKDAIYLWEAYSPVIPEAVLPAFRRALQSQAIVWASNERRPRTHYGRDDLVLVGDAVGYCHPLMATGMTLGFMDGECLARSPSFNDYRQERASKTDVHELLAQALYEVFTFTDDGTLVLRNAMYRMWRGSASECRRNAGD